jgi:hypothetical protein
VTISRSSRECPHGCFGGGSHRPLPGREAAQLPATAAVAEEGVQQGRQEADVCWSCWVDGIAAFGGHHVHPQAVGASWARPVTGVDVAGGPDWIGGI